LNEAAAHIWANSLGGSPASAVAEALAVRYGLTLAAARQDVANTLTLESDGTTIDEPDGQYVYQRSSGGYLFSRESVPLLEVEQQGRFIRLADGASAGEAASALQAVSPKLLALRGHLVLHASAILLDRSIIALSGRSGAGKTTTARALARVDAKLISEDKLLFRPAGDRIEAMVDGERSVMEWVAAAAAQLSAGKPISCEGLDDAAAGESRPLRAIGFLDSRRRSGTSIQAVRLDRAEATRAFFRSTFHGSDQPADWQRLLEAAADATSRLSAHALTVPDGLPALEAAARNFALGEALYQTAMTAS
jgi:hypothetical protein